MPRLVFFDSPFSGLSALTIDEHPVADQSGIDHYPTIPLGSIMLCHSLALVAMNASFIIRVIYQVKQVKLKVNGGGGERVFPG